MSIEFKFDYDRLSLDDMILFEDLQNGNTPSNKQMRDLMAGLLFMDGEYVDYEKAKKIIGLLRGEQLRETIDKLTKIFTEATKKSIPPANAGS
jgi:hypothetical protein